MSKTDLITRIESAGPDEQEELVWEAYDYCPHAWKGGNVLSRLESLLYAEAYVDAALMLLKEPWFVYGMGEQVSPIIYRGDRHDHLHFHADLQHREGGRLTQGVGETQALALLAAILKAKDRDHD